jgi:hypothetical protein
MFEATKGVNSSHKSKGSTAAINQRGQQQPYIKGINNSHKSKGSTAAINQKGQQQP